MAEAKKPKVVVEQAEDVPSRLDASEQASAKVEPAPQEEATAQAAAEAERDVKPAPAEDGESGADKVAVTVEPRPAVAFEPAPQQINPWLHRMFPGREHAVLGFAAGLAFAVTTLKVGFWQAVFVAACVCIGTLLGMYFDGDRNVTAAVDSMRDAK